MRLEAWYQRFGIIVLLAIIMLPPGGPSVAWRIIQWPVMLLYSLFTGLPLGLIL
ncbi:MAG: hypothetical protein ACE5JM_14860 [Armatimonadota bacterium]